MELNYLEYMDLCDALTMAMSRVARRAKAIAETVEQDELKA